ncbi:MltR family transcriptional regulator [Burkholderia ambifaria]|uniref:MltR family transcriptional regulator n=1 Tax=Burkholderia ambifaria TaxID=152480 RepID=UPI00158DBC63|nr:MltR family transcriptional regulator [Burkholderia ambifaria]
MTKVYQIVVEQEMRAILHADVDLAAESDRGVVLIVANDIEELLEKMFRKEFGSHVSGSIQKDLFDYRGALGSLSSKAKVAFAFRLLRRETYEQMELIRKLRNNVAHNSKEFSFDSPETLKILNSFGDFRELFENWVVRGVAHFATEDERLHPKAVSLNKFCFIQMSQMIKLLLTWDLENRPSLGEARSDTSEGVEPAN